MNHKKFINEMRGHKPAEYDPVLKDRVTACLKQPDIDHYPLIRTWIALLKLDPVLRGLYETSDLNLMTDALTDPFFMYGVKNIVAPIFNHETLLTRLRKSLLLSYPRTPAELLDFIYCLAEQGWKNEYIFRITEEEEKILEKIKANPDVLGVALLGCYETIKDFEDFLGERPFAQELRKNQITDPHKERELKPLLKLLGDIRDEISQKVRGQYEENPYPRWSDVSVHGQTPGAKKILVAGCGTGQQLAQVALRYFQSEITAVDLSQSSLCYAMRKSQEHGFFDRVSFYHGDIINLNALGEKFDIIYCSGVLHHMKDPDLGLKVLRGLLKESGHIEIGLYSAIARRFINIGRKYIKDKGYAATPQGIRAFRADVMDAPPYSPLKHLLVSGRDFYSLSMCRDLLFHVQEHQFSIWGIDKLLRMTDLRFSHFKIDENLKNKFRLEYPVDAALRDLGNWHEFEQKHPDAFLGMYNFVATL